MKCVSHRHILILCCWLGLPLTSHAFYQHEFGQGFVEARALFQGIGLAANNANDALLFDDDKLLGGGVSARLIVDAAVNNWQFEWHTIQSYQQDELRFAGRQLNFIADVERSDAISWRFAGDNADLLVDRLNLSYATETLNIKLGRQPVNLAASYYFTPNDFFAPFAAQTFYRTYKPGVDAARIDWNWQSLSQLTLLTVLDYDTDLSAPTLWQNSPDWGDTSYLARVSSLLGDFQWGLLAAQIQNDDIVGFDFQGELFDWLGVRGEGHMRFPDNGERDSKLALSLEYRPDSRTSLRLEQYYQRSGVTEETEYAQLGFSADSASYYLARHYTALGVSYELTPLWLTDALLLINHNDSSGLLALYASYSLSDESEFAVGINLPIGEQPVNGRVRSEFGSYPQTVTLELRSYF